MSLTFKPLYWIYHDGWKYKESKSYSVPDGKGGSVTVDESKTFNHPGHIHFFMPDMPLNTKSTMAYEGEQVYEFKITDTWGPNSTDPNQSKNIKLVGKPIWYFYIEEYWRRIYIQPWEDIESNYTCLDDINYVNKGNGRYSYFDENGKEIDFYEKDIRIIDNKRYIDTAKNNIDKKGIKYDASKPEHTFGPFREGGQFYFFNTVLNRTMPIEYWKEKSKHTRDYFVKEGEKSETSGGQTWTFPVKDQLFQWVYDSHLAPNVWSDWHTGFSYSIGRFRDIYAGTRDRHHRYYYGTNAKRLKSDEDNNLLNVDLDWEDSQWSGGWSGWFEYTGISINANSENSRKNIIYCDPEKSYSKLSSGGKTEGRYYTETDESKKKKHKANYYKRIFKPAGYDIDDFSVWTENIRKHFPSPPPYLNPDDPEDLVQLYWEYLVYYDKVCYYSMDSNRNIYMVFSEGKWETALVDYARKYRGMNKDNTNFQDYLLFEDYTTCFNNFLIDHREYFFQFEITANPATDDFYLQMSRKNSGTNPQNGKNIIQDTYGNKEWAIDYTKGSSVSGACEIYLTFNEFCEVWKPLNADEIKLLKLNGDYPIQIKELPGVPGTEQGSSSSSDVPVSAFVPLSESNTVDFTSQGRVSPDDVWKSYFDHKEIYTIPEKTMTKGDYSYGTDKDNYQYVHPREASFSIEDGARWNYPDSKYVYPVIEYQKVVHLNYERLPNKQSEEYFLENYWNQDKTGNWGDGFEIKITIPFKKNDEVQSPFSGRDKITRPIGEYFHDVIPEENKIRYHVEWHDSLLQLRKYDFPTYYGLIQEFKNQYPDYNENFALDNKGAQAYYESVREYVDENQITQKRPWTDFLYPFWNEINNQYHFSDKPVVKRNDEGKFDNINGAYRDKMTQNCITIDKVSTVTTQDGETVYGYRDSKGNIVKGGKVVEFNNPYPDHTDGKWVEQCLGAIVKPRVLLILEDPLGYRWYEWVEATALTTDTPLQGNGL